jgi:hypothetical protein
MALGLALLAGGPVRSREGVLAMGTTMDGFSGRLGAPERNHFFYGKLMDVTQFEKDARYFNLKRCMINRLILGSGVVCGLKVEADPNATVQGSLRITPGVAIDPWGREIVVAEPVSFDRYALTTNDGNPTGETATGDIIVCLAYAEAKADLVPVLIPDCDTTGNCAPSTIREGFRVLVRQAPAVGAEPAHCTVVPTESWAAPLPAVLQELIATRPGEECPEALEDPCVVVAHVTSAGQVRVDARQLVYTNALLYELILCLAQRVLQPPA